MNTMVQLAERFRLPTRSEIDHRLIVGSAIFGIGWGIAGYCPGPALAIIASAFGEAVWFVPAMLIGMAVHRTVERNRIG